MRGFTMDTDDRDWLANILVMLDNGNAAGAAEEIRDFLSGYPDYMEESDT